MTDYLRRAWRIPVGSALYALAALAPFLSYLNAKAGGLPVSPEKWLTLAGVCLSLLWIGLLLVMDEIDRRRRAAEFDLRRYMERLRRYAVTNIEPMRVELDKLGAAQVLPPPVEVPVSPEDSERPLKTRERDTLLRILYGMSIASPYGYDPSAPRNEATATIASATDAAGCGVDPDTVRKYLKEAAEKFGNARRSGR